MPLHTLLARANKLTIPTLRTNYLGNSFHYSDTVFPRIKAGVIISFFAQKGGDYSRDGYYSKKYGSLPQTLRQAESLEWMTGDTFLTKTLEKRIFHFQIDKSC